MIDTIDFSGLWQVLVGYGCMLLALLFWFVWPKTKAKPYSKRISWPGYILHFFHPLAWVLFGLASFSQLGQPIVSALLAVLGVIVYLIFIILFIKA